MKNETQNNNESSSKNLFYILIIFLVGALFLGLILGNENELAEVPTTPEPDNSTESDNEFLQSDFYVEFTGIATTGDDIGRDYCAEGLYLVQDTEPASTLLMREIPTENSSPKMLSLEEYEDYIGEQVAVQGYYTSEKAMCMALMCDCEDFMLVSQIEVVQ